MPKASYILTPTARQHLREAKNWSFARWGEELTKEYFHELEKTALFIAENHNKLTKQQELGIYPVRSHYIIYIAISANKIAIADIIRQGRDVTALLSKHTFSIQHEINKLKQTV